MRGSKIPGPSRWAPPWPPAWPRSPPRIRGILSTVLGVPSPVLGLVEDYLALKVGGDALGMSMQDVKSIGEESFEDVKGYVTAMTSGSGLGLGSGESSPQSVGAGSM